MAGWLRLLDDSLYNVASGVAQLNGSGFLAHEQGGLEADASAFNGLIKISGGTTSTITDSSTNWDTAYTHSQTTTGNPHSLNPNDLDALSAHWDLGGTFAIRSSYTPVADSDLANKAYVDGIAQGLDVKASVVCNSTTTSTEGTGYSYSNTGGTSARGQITWSSGPTTIDGVTLANSDRILNSETGAAGGIWVRTAQNTWDRATDFDEDDEVTAGSFVFVEEGTTYADSGWVLTTNDPITIGGASGTSLTWSQFSGGGSITAGAGLTKTGNTLDVGGTTNRITVNADTVDIAATYVGQTSITTLGTVATGTWSATQIGPTFGGTGLTSFSSGDVLYASGANTWAAAAPGATSGVQPYDADLAAIAALSNADGNFIVGNGSAWVAESGTTVRDSLGLGTGDDPTFNNLSVNDLALTGDIVYSNVVVTLSTGAGTITSSLSSIAAETGTADDLDTINGGQSGQVAWFRADTGDTITIKNGTGNIQTSGGDILMTDDTLIPMVYDGSNWHVTDFAGTVSAHAMGGSSHTADTNANVSSKISDLTGVIVGTTDIQTVSNKRFASESNYFVDGSDNTKRFYFLASGISAGTTRVYTMPNYDATIATLAGTETFTSKTLTSPDINGGTVDAITSLTPGANLTLGTTYTFSTRLVPNQGVTGSRPGSPGNYELYFDTTVAGLLYYNPI